MLSNPGHAGRPSKVEQLDKKIQLFSYFEKRIKPKQAAKETGIDVKTVRDYFDALSEIVYKNQEKGFLERSRLAKERALLKIAIRIEKLEKHSDELEEKLNAVKWSLSPEYIPVHEKYDKIQVAIAKLELEKCNLECSPTADTKLKIDTNNLLKGESDPGGPTNV